MFRLFIDLVLILEGVSLVGFESLDQEPLGLSLRLVIIVLGLAGHSDRISKVELVELLQTFLILSDSLRRFHCGSYDKPCCLVIGGRRSGTGSLESEG